MCPLAAGALSAPAAGSHAGLAQGGCHLYLPFRGRLDRTAFRYFL